MAMTQMQLIHSLGEAMSWLEREMAWGVDAAELRHLTGRIGELYVALLTNGQMAMNVNQKGYDVISHAGERISVKTTTMDGGAGHIPFNPNTLKDVDRVIILKLNTQEMQVEVLYDSPVKEAESLMSNATADGKKNIALSKIVSKTKPRSDLKIINSRKFRNVLISEYETGTIEALADGGPVKALPELRRIAAELNIGVLNGAGNPHNTRQLGTLILSELAARDHRSGEAHG